MMEKKIVNCLVFGKDLKGNDLEDFCIINIKFKISKHNREEIEIYVIRNIEGCLKSIYLGSCKRGQVRHLRNVDNSNVTYRDYVIEGE